MGTQQWYNYRAELNWTALGASENLAAVAKLKIYSTAADCSYWKSLWEEHSADLEEILD